VGDRGLVPDLNRRPSGGWEGWFCIFLFFTNQTICLLILSNTYGIWEQHSRYDKRPFPKQACYVELLKKYHQQRCTGKGKNRKIAIIITPLQPPCVLLL